MAAVRLTVSHLVRIELPSGEAGCQVDFTAMEPEGPRVIQQIDLSDPREAGKAVGAIVQGTIQGMGMAQRQMPKMVLFLTMREYADLGSPMINEVLEADFYSDYRSESGKPPREEQGAFIRLRKAGK